MSTYIGLLEFTQDGIENIEDSPNRLNAAKDLSEEFSGELQSCHLAMGQIDAVTVGEFPDDETYAQYALLIGSQGAVSTETLIALPEYDYRDIIEGVVESLAGAPGCVPGDG